MMKALFLSLFLMPFCLYGQGVPLTGDVKKTSDMSLEEQERFRSVAELLRCPTCQGLSVLESEAAFSLQIQARVKEQLKAGKSDEEIFQFFRQRYGNWILREPPKEGVNLFAWVFPIVLLLLGPLAVWFFVWRRQVDGQVVGVRSVESILEEFNQAVDTWEGRV